MDSPSIKYLAQLALAIAAGVFLALFAFDVYREHRAKAQLQAVVDGLQEFAAELGTRSATELSEIKRRAAEQVEARRREQRRQRERSQLGQTLSRRCAEWTRADEQFSTTASREGAAKACRDLEYYLANGHLRRETSQSSARIWKEE